jgi:hypothetical protein
VSAVRSMVSVADKSAEADLLREKNIVPRLISLKRISVYSSVSYGSRLSL